MRLEKWILQEHPLAKGERFGERVISREISWGRGKGIVTKVSNSVAISQKKR